MLAQVSGAFPLIISATNQRSLARSGEFKFAYLESLSHELLMPRNSRIHPIKALACNSILKSRQPF